MFGAAVTHLTTMREKQRKHRKGNQHLEVSKCLSQPPLALHTSRLLTCGIASGLSLKPFGSGIQLLAAKKILTNVQDKMKNLATA